MKAHEEGHISTEKVQRINKKGVTVKYKAEVASQTYKQQIEGVNAMVKLLRNGGNGDHFCDWMQMMQELEESRINFMKYNLEKFMRHISNFGKNVESQAKKVQE